MIGKIIAAGGIALGIVWIYSQAGKPDKEWRPRGQTRGGGLPDVDDVPRACKEWPFRYKDRCWCLNRNDRPLRLKAAWKKCSKAMPKYADLSLVRARGK